MGIFHHTFSKDSNLLQWTKEHMIRINAEHKRYDSVYMTEM